MGQTEILMVVVLIVLSLLLGVLFGGSSVWYLKPSQDTKVIQSTVQKFVCADGSIRDTPGQCPKVETKDGVTELVCPPCECTDVPGSPYRQCDCTLCAVQCGTPVHVPVTTTTIYVPSLKTCETDSDCGQIFYEKTCRYSQEYRVVNTPFCDKGYCKVTQKQEMTRECTDDENCISGKGCVYSPSDD